MPQRTNNVNNGTTGSFSGNSNNVSEYIDLSFLPKAMVDKIQGIFDMYFGFQLPKKYNIEIETVPSFPNKVSSLNSGEIGDIHGAYAAWLSFTRDKLKYVSVALSTVNSEMEIAYSNAIKLASGSNKEAREAEAKTDGNYLLIKTYYDKLAALKEMLSLDCDKYDGMVSSLSREISRREANLGF